MGSNAGPDFREEKMKEQNQEYFKLYDQLATQLSEADQIAILEANDQYLPEENGEVHLHYTYSHSHISAEIVTYNQQCALICQLMFLLFFF